MRKKKRSKGRSKKTRDTKTRTSSNNLAAEAYAQTAAKIIIEKEPSIEGGSFLSFITILYGVPKIGKSTLAFCLKGAYFLPTEPGYKFVKIRKTKISNWATFKQFIKYMEDNQSALDDIECFVVDTTDNLSKFCMQYACGREKIAHPSDEEWGKGWEAYRDEFTHWILRLCDLGPGVMFISHEQEREIKSRGLMINKATPALPKTCYTVINNLADIILRMGFYTAKKRKGVKRTKNQRCLFTKPTENMDAGDRTGLLPAVIPFKTEKEVVATLMEYFEEEEE